jgi:phosphate-selective porin OprO and OprP
VKSLVVLLVLATPAFAEPELATSDPPVDVPPVPPAPPVVVAPTPPPAPAIDRALLAQLVDERIAAAPKTAGWKDGFYIQTAAGDSKLTIGGFTQFDGRFFVVDRTPAQVDQFGFRSIRPDLRGTLLDHYDVRLMPDFAGGKVVVQDAYIDVRYANEIKFRFGKFKVPFGLERLEAETSTTFVDRGLPTQLVPNRDLGAQVFGELASGVVAYQLGVFNGVADGGSGDGDVSDDKEGAARVLVKPFATGSTAVKNLAFGGAATFGDKTGTLAQPDTPTWKTQGQSTILAYKVGTTLMDTVVADGRHWRASAQGYWYTGPFGVLAEYVRSDQKLVLNGTHVAATADSWQVVGQWVLTGDDATFNSVAPRRPFDPSKGQWGAVDVAARIGELRFADGQVFDAGFADPSKSARRAWSAGAGADWFANKTFRFVLDVERTYFRFGANAAADRAPETSITGRVQTVF